MKTSLIKSSLALAALIMLNPTSAIAADHTDSPAAADDPAADIADLYVWHTEDERLVSVLTFAGLTGAGEPASYDDEMLYGIHIDRDGDNVSDHDIWFRFGEDTAGNWGVMASGLPGETDPLIGAVDEVLDSDAGAQVFAGPREDPFFFDFEGFTDTLATGTLSFDAERDSFMGTNVTALVVEMDLAAVADGATSLSMWATSRRKN